MSRKKYPHNENTIGGRLRRFREETGIKTADFAKMLGISQGSLSDIEHNKTSPSAKPVEGLVQKTDINIYWLFTGQGEMRRATGGASSVSPDENEDLSHSDIIKRFSDPIMARDANLGLLKIERSDEALFREVCAYIKGVARGLRDSVETVRVAQGEDRRRSDREGLDATGTDGAAPILPRRPSKVGKL